MKKTYIAPKALVQDIEIEDVMITASPGIGDDWDDGMVLDSKGGSRNDFYLEEDDEDTDDDILLYKSNRLFW